MNVNFKYNAAGAVKPVVFEQIFAEKPAGGMVKNPTYDAPQGTAVSDNGDGTFSLIKSYRLVEAVKTSDTKIRIAKNSGVEKGDAIGHGTKAVACTAVNTSNDSYDEVTVTLGENIAEGTNLYQAKAAAESGAEPYATPVYVIGNELAANEGDQMVRLVNGANLRKETAGIAPELAALIPTITLV